MRRMFVLLLNVNICLVLDGLTRPEYRFSKRQPDAPGVPDFTCHYFVESLILVIEVKRKHVLENINGRHFQADEKGKNGDSTNLQLYGENKRRYEQQKFSFSDFKFKGILGEGRNGKTLLCEFRGVTIALKSAKAPPYVLEEMQKEVEIYKDLADIQGKYFPKLV
ncbi:hypothetical protein RhiirA4_413282 [Rhizophagus irregularis]|uniref:Protein kinase domain-containing protein n=1 Tax=Rhizophagus irregularis TaxID=588596 RepID=A0A2I1FSL8_9GLOM|nr:hypothetical protein RhiirA4_413282 [Rhizophagus irregularis]